MNCSAPPPLPYQVLALPIYVHRNRITLGRDATLHVTEIADESVSSSAAARFYSLPFLFSAVSFLRRVRFVFTVPTARVLSPFCDR